MPTEILSLEVKEDGTRVVKRSIEGVGRASEKADKAVVDLQKDLKNFTKQINPVNQLRRALGGIGGALALGSALRETFAFGDAIAEVSTLVDETVFNMDELTRAAKEQAIEFGKTPVNQTKALYQIISAGASDSADAIETLNAANKLAVGGVTEVAIAADGLTTILNAYGDAAGSASDVSDTLFVGVRAGKTTVEELSTTLGRVVPLANSLGVSFEELVAGTAALTKGGISTAESVTGLRAVLAAVAKPSQEASKLANQLGIEFNTAGIQSQGLSGFIQDIIDRTNGSKNALATLFGGVEALVPVLALSGEAGEDFTAILDSMNNKAGETEAAFEKMQTPGQRFRQLMSTLQVAVINVGDFLARILNPAMEFLVKNFDDLTIASGAFLATLAVFKIKAIGSAIVALSVAVKGLTLALAANPIVLFAVAISGAISALVFFRKEIKLTETGFASLNDFIVVSYEVMRDFVRAGVAAFREFLSVLDGEFFTGFTTIFDNLLNISFADFVRGIAFGVDVIIGAFNGLGRAIGAGIASSLIRVQDLFQNTLNQIQRFFEDTINKIIRTTNSISGRQLFEEVDFNIPPEIRRTAQGLGSDIADAFIEGSRVSFAQDAVNNVLVRAEERALSRNTNPNRSDINLPETIGSATGLSGDAEGFDEKTIAAIRQINKELQIESDILQTASPRARELKEQLLAIKNNLEGQNIFLSDDQLEEAFLATLKLNQGLREQLAVLNEIKGPQEDFTNQIKAITDLIDSGQISQGEGAQAIISASNLIDFEGTQTQLDAFVELNRQAYEQIAELQNQNLIDDKTANQLRLKADLELAEKRLQGAKTFFGTLSGLSRSENKKLAAIGKAAAITQATIDGVLAVQKALSAYPPPVNFALAAAVGAVAAANVAEIASARQLGGDLNSGQLSRVGEGTRPEVFRSSATGQQFFIPPERGRIEPLSSSDENRSESSNANSSSEPTQQSVRIINVLDPATVGDYLNSSEGEQVLINTIRSNSDSIRQIVSEA